MLPIQSERGVRREKKRARLERKIRSSKQLFESNFEASSKLKANFEQFERRRGLEGKRGRFAELEDFRQGGKAPSDFI